MIKPAPVPRWALSFADLALLLLAFFVLLHAAGGRQVAAAARAAFPGTPVAGPLLDEDAPRLFEPGEARLTLAAQSRLEVLARNARGPLRVESSGRELGGARYDGWELSAARAAALARVLDRSGNRVSIAMIEEKRPGEAGQRLTVRAGR